MKYRDEANTKEQGGDGTTPSRPAIRTCLGRDAVTDIHKLFDWANTSPRGLLLPRAG